MQFDGFDKQFVACLDKDTGNTVWQKPRDLPYPNNGDLKKGFATPAILHVNGKPLVEITPRSAGFYEVHRDHDRLSLHADRGQSALSWSFRPPDAILPDA